MATFIGALVFVALAMTGLGIGVILRGRSVKGHCNGSSCSSMSEDGECQTPELAISNCQKTFHLPGQ